MNPHYTIITCIDENYEENLEYDFLLTLRETAKFSGQIIVLDFGMSIERKKRIIEKYKVDVFSYKKTMAVYTLRNKYIPKLIDELPNEIEQIMLIDGGDVWFQKKIDSIFRLTINRLGFTVEPILFGENRWLQSCLDNLPSNVYDDIISFSKGKKCKNAGMICGPRKIVRDLSMRIYELTRKVGIDYFGVDQLFFNFEVNKFSSDSVICLDNEYNYSLITHKDEYKIDRDRIFDINNCLVTVVHNTGGNWRELKRPFKNKNMNEDQYYPENVREFVL